MSGQGEDQIESKSVNIQASTTFEPMQAGTRVKILPTDRIEVEDSDTLQYLRLRNGDLQLRQKLFASIDGERTQITVDSLPD